MAQNNAVHDVYPIATLDGKQIRYDVQRPNILTVLAALLGADTPYAVQDSTRILSVYPVVDVQVLYVATPNSILHTAGFVAPKGVQSLVQLPAGVTTLYIRALALAGNAYIQEMDSWHGLTTPEATQIG